MKRVRHLIGAVVGLAPAVAIAAPGMATAAAKPAPALAKTKPAKSVRPSINAACQGQAPVSGYSGYNTETFWYTHHPSGHPNSDCIGTINGSYTALNVGPISKERFRIRNAANQIEYSHYVTATGGCDSLDCHYTGTVVVRQTFPDPVLVCTMGIEHGASVPGTQAACAKVN